LEGGSRDTEWWENVGQKSLQYKKSGNTVKTAWTLTKESTADQTNCVTADQWNITFIPWLDVET